MIEHRFTRRASGLRDGIKDLEDLIREEMYQSQIGGVSCALVADDQLVYAAGFGDALRESIFRVGSVSKIFTALALMQQVEAEMLVLDTSLPRALLPFNPFVDAPAVTLRQVLCHRAGLPREPPVGGYFDASEPTLAQTAASVPECVLVTRPGEKARYSNIGAVIAGVLIAQASGMPFERYQRTCVIEPLGVRHSSWSLRQTRLDRLLHGRMRVADGRGGWTLREAPLFDLGASPAGNLFSTVDDLARLAMALLSGGAGLLRSQTLQEMWRPQLTEDASGYGIGFCVDRYGGHRRVGHGGAVYGYSSSVALLPEQGMAVVVLANEDLCYAAVRRISDACLEVLLDEKGKVRCGAVAHPAGSADLSECVGDYESESSWCRLEVSDGQLLGDFSGQLTRFTPMGGLKFKACSRIEIATDGEFKRNPAGTIDGFVMGNQTYARVLSQPTRLPSSWHRYLGTYGPEYLPLVIAERHGHLYAMTENMIDYRLTPLNRNVFALPPGLYTGEQVVFLSDRDGQIHGLNFANMILPRRSQ